MNVQQCGPRPTAHRLCAMCKDAGHLGCEKSRFETGAALIAGKRGPDGERGDLCQIWRAAAISLIIDGAA